MSNEPDLFAAKVDAKLRALGTRLTMGGEPTFVPVRPEGDEWRTDAIGPTKLAYARRFARKMLQAVYPGALAMQVFGKWYPGEVLPRWNLMILANDDETDLWKVPERLLLEDRVGSNSRDVSAELIRKIRLGLNLGEDPIPGWNEIDAREPAGWILPLDHDEGGWFSDDWSEREEERIVLFPGDSPVGLRIPLGDLGEDALKRALTIEVRKGAVEVFLPPLDHQPFVELVRLIEAKVVEMDLFDVVLCGYVPVSLIDHFDVFGIAADPGVLEVNLPPREDWEGYRKILGSAVEAATSVGLSLTKYGLNGVVNGSGGGSHLAFGGPSEEENPFLADPRRIASFLRYVQHHPVLSYGFTGKFVGPGSQAPRVDEGPRHGLYELEVACEGLEGQGETVDGPMIDQFLKNLMTDAAGNTHRAEICFDKFHNRSAPNGMQGIIELRAFETLGTGEDMGRVALLIRSIFARVFQVPFSEPLKRHGADLHDRFFLPSFLWKDLVEVCEDLHEFGMDYDPEWLRGSFEFRFPECGRLTVPGDGVDLVVRQGLESWPLMAEESQGAATVRVVDNSTDRVELSLRDGDRILESWGLLANGIEVPFRREGDRWIAGLRYKCASAYPALHPHVPIQSPLELDWVKRTDGTVGAAADYHYWEPGGGVYTRAPLDTAEAAARRAERWIPRPDREGLSRKPRRPRMAPEFSYTLDLRRQLVG